MERLGTLAGAAAAAGVNRSSIYKVVEADPAFAARVRQALDVYTDRLEAAVDERAFAGHDEDVFQGGVRVGTRKVFSDRLAELRLRALRPSVYRDPEKETGRSLVVNVEVTALGSGSVVPVGHMEPPAVSPRLGAGCVVEVEIPGGDGS